MKIIALLLSLTLLVVTHELGHLIAAKSCGMRVRRYYVFFNWGFSILKIKKFDGKWHILFFNSKTPQEWEEKEPDNTIWGLGWLPLGGYCDIAGMIDETKSADDLEKEPQPWEYRSKPAWQRLIVISAGVIVNFISALIIYTGIFAHWGKDELPLQNARLGYDYCDLLLKEGFQNGDIIYSIDGEVMTDITATEQKLLLDKPGVVTVKRMVRTAGTDSSQQTIAKDSIAMVDIALSGDLLQLIDKQKPTSLMAIRSPFVVKDFAPGSNAKEGGMEIGDSVVRMANREAETYTEITEVLQEYKNDTITIGFYRAGEYKELPIKVDNAGKLGVMLKSPIEMFEVEHTNYNIITAIPVGIKYGCTQLVTYVKSLRVIFTKDGAQSLGGFGTLGSLFPQEWNWWQFWNITAFLAVILAFMNVIPIPGLDGGHILFTLWEIISGRKPSDKFLEVAQTIGMILLLALLVVANGNDILRAFR